MNKTDISSLMENVNNNTVRFDYRYDLTIKNLSLTNIDPLLDQESLLLLSSRCLPTTILLEKEAGVYECLNNKKILSTLLYVQQQEHSLEPRAFVRKILETYVPVLIFRQQSDEKTRNILIKKLLNT